MANPHITSDFTAGLSRLDHYLKSHSKLIYRGIEKEGLRVAKNLSIAQSDHPSSLGHPLTHDSITTDYSEALLELITPVKESRESLMQDLSEIHHYVQQHIDDELLWAGSMPCVLNGDASIRIAEYGNSNIGQLKHTYRQGLGVRYGRVMQSIAGLHFNFSLDDAFWEQWRLETPSAAEQSLKDFKSDRYFALIRNFRRQAWLLMYLFGASPVLDQSFVAGRAHDLDSFDDKGSLFKPYATSLRMGDLGYHNNAQASLAICFNNLNNFTNTLRSAIHTSYPAYEKIGIHDGKKYIQLNTNILQIENEYYSSIRPKRTTYSGEKPTQALIERGVEYIEVRCLDLNPLLPCGISESQVDFMDLFLLQCLLTDSPYIPDAECQVIDRNFSKTVNAGRDPKLRLEGPEGAVSPRQWGLDILSQMDDLADKMDRYTADQRYTKALLQEREKLLQSDLCPSAQILQIMRSESLSWIELASELSRKHKAISAQLAPEKLADIERRFQHDAECSFEKARQIEASDKISFDAFLEAYQQ